MVTYQMRHINRSTSNVAQNSDASARMSTGDLMILGQKNIKSLFRAQSALLRALLVLCLLHISTQAQAQKPVLIEFSGSYFNQSENDTDLHGAQLASQLRMAWNKNSALIFGLRAEFPILGLSKDDSKTETVEFMSLQNAQLQLHFAGLAYIDQGSQANLYLSAGAFVDLRPQAALLADPLFDGLALGGELSLGVDVLSVSCCQPGLFLRYAMIASLRELSTNSLADNCLSIGFSLGFDLRKISHNAASSN